MTTLYTAAVLRNLVIAALEAGIASGALAGHVRSPADTATAEAELPCYIVRSGRQRKVQNTPGPLNFTSTIEISVSAQLESSVSAEDVQHRAERTAFAIEAAVWGYLPLLKSVQQWAYVDELVTIDASAEAHIAEVDMVFAMEVFEIVRPPDGAPVRLQLRVLAPSGGNEK